MIKAGLAGKRHGGFSRLELMVVVMVIAVLATALLDRLFYYQEVAEKAQMEYTISRVRSALRLRMATLLTAGRAQEYALLAKQNPINWLEDKPSNYGGELTASDNRKLEAGNWYFDMSSQTLLYLVRRGEHFNPDSKELKQVRLKVVSVHNRQFVAGNSVADGPSDSLTVQLVEPYRWF